MLKEIKYLIFILIICIFLFFTGKYYFSDTNKKNSYRSFNQINDKIQIYSQNLNLLENDTNNVVEYIEKSIDSNKKDYNFWKLIGIND